MKCVFVVLSCLLGAASAGYAAPGYPYGYPAAPYNHAAGIPLPVQDTYEVAAAKAEHLRAHAAARAQAGAAPAPHYYGAHPAAAPAGPPQPVQDTYEVAAAKAEHFRAHAAARADAAHAAPFAHAHGYPQAPVPAHYGYSSVAQGYPHYGASASLVDPVAIAAGAPLPVADTYEVAAAKAAHLQAHAAAKSAHLGYY